MNSFAAFSASLYAQTVVLQPPDSLALPPSYADQQFLIVLAQFTRSPIKEPFHHFVSRQLYLFTDDAHACTATLLPPSTGMDGGFLRVGLPVGG